MKLNLGCGLDIRNDYTNVDLLQIDLPKEIYRNGDITNIDWIAEESSVDEILALDVLQYIQLSKVQDSLSNWISKLKSGGIIKISTVDIMALAEDFANNKITLSDFVFTAYGKQDHPVNFAKSAIDSSTLTKFLTSNGLKIINMQYKPQKTTIFYIEAQK